jgi:DegV family protein with EDD domain
MKIGIVTDSPADLPADLAAQYGIEVIPSILVIDEQPYMDGKDITREQFYTLLPSLKTAPTTAAPSIGDFQARYRKLLGAGCEHIISLHTAQKLTSIAGIARMSAVDFPEQVTVLESGSLSLGLGFQALAAAEALENHADLAGALAAIRSTRERLFVYAALDTMEYVRRSGRIPPAVAALGGALSIKPVVELREGQVRPMAASRTTSQSTEKLFALLTDLGPLERLAILHTNAPQRARDFLNALMAAHPRSISRDILVVNVTTVIGTHVGPNGLGLAAVKAGNL